MTRQSLYVKLLFTVILALLLAACGGGGGGDTGGDGGGGDAGSPADAARAFWDALLKGEGDLASMYCAAVPEEMKAGMDQMKTALTASAAAGGEIDTSGLTFTEQNVSGDSAEVVVGGSIKVTVAGASTDIPIPEGVVMPMKNENGWKVCG